MALTTLVLASYLPWIFTSLAILLSWIEGDFVGLFDACCYCSWFDFLFLASCTILGSMFGAWGVAWVSCSCLFWYFLLSTGSFVFGQFSTPFPDSCKKMCLNSWIGAHILKIIEIALPFPWTCTFLNFFNMPPKRIIVKPLARLRSHLSSLVGIHHYYKENLIMDLQ